ncbi:MAG: SPFH domain-containing protein [Spirochaetales bacterium]|nr:SPFH domain-containing protein [Spirochaetales bacterium]
MSATEKGKRKIPWTGILVLAVFMMIVIPVFSTSFYTVNYDQTALVFRFGTLHAVREAGSYSKVPFGVDRIARIPTGNPQIITLPVGRGDTGVYPYTSSEGLPVYVSMNVIYRITDPLAWYSAGGSQDLLIYAHIQDILVKKIAGMKIAELRDKKQGLSRLLLAGLLNDRTLAGWGIKADKTELLQIDIPLNDPAMVGADEKIIDLTVTTMLAAMKENYKKAYAGGSLNEDVMARIKEDGYPWE